MKAENPGDSKKIIQIFTYKSSMSRLEQMQLYSMYKSGFCAISMRLYKEYIHIYKEETAASCVFSTFVFCLRKPEAVRKMTQEPLLAEW